MLTELKIKNLKPKDKRYLIADTDGLCIAVMPSGKKYWYVRTTVNGKERKVSIGQYPAIGLKDARRLRQTMSLEQSMPHKFKDVFDEWYNERYIKMVKANTARNTLLRFRLHALPVLGNMDLDDIKPRDVLVLMRGIKAPVVSRRVRTTISQVFAYAVASGLTEWNPAQQVLGAMPPVPAVKHRSTIQTEEDARHVLCAIRDTEMNEIARLCLLFLAHTFVRPSEARCATWAEFDGDTWNIPAKRMKAKRPHIVPLSPQVQTILKDARDLAQNTAYVFAIPMADKYISTATLTTSLRKTKADATPHSFRGMASTLLNEHGFTSDVIERQLAHAEANAVRAAYNCAEYLPQRREMMNWWSNYLEELMKSG